MQDSQNGTRLPGTSFRSLTECGLNTCDVGAPCQGLGSQTRGRLRPRPSAALDQTGERERDAAW